MRGINESRVRETAETLSPELLSELAFGDAASDACWGSVPSSLVRCMYVQAQVAPQVCAVDIDLPTVCAHSLHTATQIIPRFRKSWYRISRTKGSGPD